MIEIWKQGKMKIAIKRIETSRISFKEYELYDSWDGYGCEAAEEST